MNISFSYFKCCECRLRYLCPLFEDSRSHNANWKWHLGEKERELEKSAQSWIREEREASLVAVLTNWNAESEREYQKGKKLRTPRKTFSGHLRFFFSFFYGIRRRFESTSQQVFRADSHGNQIKIAIVGETSERRQQSCFLRKVDFKQRKREKEISDFLQNFSPFSRFLINVSQLLLNYSQQIGWI